MPIQTPKTLSDEFATVATLDDIDDCLRTLSVEPLRNEALIDFWLDLRILVKAGNASDGSNTKQEGSS